MQDTIILAINSAAAAKAVIEKHMNSKRSYAGFSIIHVYYQLTLLFSLIVPFSAILDALSCAVSGVLLSCGMHWLFLWRQFPLYSISLFSCCIGFQVLDPKHRCSSH